MDWLIDLCSIPSNVVMDVSIPTHKLIKNIKTQSLRKEMQYELQNVEDVIYRTIFRDHADGENDYNEFHIVEIKLRKPQYVKTIAKACHEAIPYSKLIVFSSNEKHLLFCAGKDDKAYARANFTPWLYKEEIDFYYDQVCGKYADGFSKPWMRTLACIEEMVYEAEDGDYICLRRLIDLLKIREIKDDAEYISEILSQLAQDDKIALYKDNYFVLRDEADAYYDQQKIHLYGSSSIEDRRFGADKQFNLLETSEFTTTAEAIELLTKAMNTDLYDEEN